MGTFDRNKARAKPQLTLRIFLWGLVDVIGIGMFSIGLVHFVHGPGAVFKRFPTNAAEAVVTIVCGGGIMVYAAAHILRELMKQPQLMEQDKDPAG